MKNFTALLALSLLVSGLCHASEESDKYNAELKTKSNAAVNREIGKQFAKIVGACGASAIPVALSGIVNLIPLAPVVMDSAIRDNDPSYFEKLEKLGASFDDHDPNDVFGPLMLGGALSAVGDVAGTLVRMGKAPFTYLAHGEISTPVFGDKLFSWTKAAFLPTRSTAAIMYGKDSVCSQSKERFASARAEKKRRKEQNKTAPATQLAESAAAKAVTSSDAAAKPTSSDGSAQSVN